MAKDKENLYELEVSLCSLVGIAEDAVGKEEFEKLDNAGADIVECLGELAGLREKEQESRNKEIDEFAERMSLEISESIIGGMLFDNRDNSSYDTADKIVDYVIDTSKKIAEEMRGAV